LEPWIAHRPGIGAPVPDDAKENKMSAYERKGRSSPAALTAGRRLVALAVSAGLIALTLAAGALAALPKAGARFAGTTSQAPIEGFHAPVSFVVSHGRSSLTGFAFSTLGCFGAGGFRTGEDEFTKPFAIVKVGTVKLAKNGSVSARGVKFTDAPNKTTTVVSVSGKFTSAKAISGSITFSQTNRTASTIACGPAHLSFTAKAH
jgi:hypothetical protein